MNHAPTVIHHAPTVTHPVPVGYTNRPNHADRPACSLRTQHDSRVGRDKAWFTSYIFCLLFISIDQTML